MALGWIGPYLTAVIRNQECEDSRQSPFTYPKNSFVREVFLGWPSRPLGKVSFPFWAQNPLKSHQSFPDCLRQWIHPEETPVYFMHSDSWRWTGSALDRKPLGIVFLPVGFYIGQLKVKG